MADQCLFCQIVEDKVPSNKVKETDNVLAFQDINPAAPTHVLVIPKEHMESLEEASQHDEPLLGHLLRIGARMANAEGLGESGYRTVINTGAGAGQSVFHLHVHVLGGRQMNWPPG